MNKEKIVNLLPALFTGAGMAFGGAATVSGIKRTFDMCEDGYGKDYFANDDISIQEKLKVVGKYHWPTFVATGVAAGCFMSSVDKYTKVAAIATTAPYWKKYAKEYRRKNRELYGEENDREIEKSIAEDHISKLKPKKHRDPNALWFYDPITKQDFEATPAELDFAERSMNDILSKGCPVEYWYLLKHFRGVNWDQPICRDIGWHLDDTYEDYHYYNESFFGHIMFRILRDEYKDTQYGRCYILRCNLEPMLNVDLDSDVVKDSQELHCL